jgi:hypothetical protein
MKRLLRILGLVLALGLVSLTTADAWPYDEDLCFYACGDDYSTSYQMWTSQRDCCGRSSQPTWWCPNGETPTVIGWGGMYTPLSSC